MPPPSRILAVIGCILLAGPLFGLAGTIVGMIRAFSKLEVSGHADPNVLAGDISMALLTTLYGLAFGLLGVALVSLVLFRRINREKWFYMCVISLSVMWCVMLFPVGLVVGIYLIITFTKRKSEFLPLTKELADQVAPSTPY